MTQTNEPLLEHSNHQQEQHSLLRHSDNNFVKQTWAESKKLWHIAAPSIFSRLSMFSLTVITQSLSGHLSDHDLAAISIATTVIIAISFGFLLGMASALETLCGQAYGAKQYQMLGVYMQRSWIVLFVSSILLLPIFVYATPILKFAGQPEDLAELTGVVALRLIPMHLSFAFQFTLMRFLQCQLKTGIIAFVSGGTLLLHILLCWIFVFKLRVGIVGAALILDFSWWASVFGLAGYIVFGGCPQTWNGLSDQAFVGLWDFTKLSLASGVMLSLEHFYFRMLIIVSGAIQNVEVAVDALSICMTIYGWESMIPLGLFAATGVRVANELGAKNSNGAKFSAQVAVLNSVALGFLFWSIVMVFPDKLAMIFTSSPSVIKMVNELSYLLAATIAFNSVQPVLSGVAVGTGWQGLVALANLLSYYFIGAPLGIIFGWTLDFGFEGVWAGMIGGTIFQTIILIIITIRIPWDEEVNILIAPPLATPHPVLLLLPLCLFPVLSHPPN